MDKIKKFLLRCWYYPTFQDFYNDKYKIEDILSTMAIIRFVLSVILGSIIGTIIIFNGKSNFIVGFIVASIITFLNFFLWVPNTQKQFDVLKQEEIKNQENTVIDDLAEIKEIAITLLPDTSNEIQDQLLQICLLVNRIEKQLYQKQKESA
ncbi:MAG: hypothetical protein PWR08_1643 [Thermoanaerobacterium sp.]|uniref:Uncharacterized protein n=1 Tax=Thermoanaerobacterium butyriciformans TaxID=1702242 RepID=A0ABS4NB26_9THEO|nr:hypothetical protein [Thermoanaerobacterium butyriciformans]MBP2070869.1 hypothetical protein [Thermoanaerobacterium butyriciformans]MDN5317518.1 hypothetical protein [Thermoanaerobacterium sp.]